jgi:nucleoside-diphosphate-sugar epimerase
MFFGEDVIGHFSGNSNFELVKADIRTADGSVLKGVDAVVDMASLSNDPSAELNPALTMEINYRGRVRIAKMAKESGTSKYILMSSCSVYGFNEHIVDEDSEPNPLTVYAKANLAAERDVLPLNSDRFNVTALRLATVFGPSKRMRFDLLVNGMTLNAFLEGRIPVMRDGNQRRPLVHVLDVSRAIARVIESDGRKTGGEVVNIGHEGQNHRVIEVAEITQRVVGGEISMYGDPDTRSYAVRFEKARSLLGFTPLFSVEDGVKQIYHELLLGNLRQDPRWITLKWYKSLLERDPRALEA